MSIVKDIEKVIEEKKDELRKDQKFCDLEAFYLEMKEKGLVRESEYDLPLLDTLGHIYQAS